MRAMELHDIQAQVRKIDDMFYDDVMDFLRCVPDGERTEMETNIMGLPGNMGGLGIYSHHSELSSLARRASVSTSRNELIQRELSTKQLLVHLAPAVRGDVPRRQQGSVAAASHPIAAQSGWLRKELS